MLSSSSTAKSVKILFKMASYNYTLFAGSIPKSSLTQKLHLVKNALENSLRSVF